jgi:predicted transporter
MMMHGPANVGIHKPLFTIGVNRGLRVEKSNFSANMAKIIWAVYLVSWHSIGNVTHFKEITSLKQTYK